MNGKEKLAIWLTHSVYMHIANGTMTSLYVYICLSVCVCMFVIFFLSHFTNLLWFYFCTDEVENARKINFIESIWNCHYNNYFFIIFTHRIIMTRFHVNYNTFKCFMTRKAINTTFWWMDKNKSYNFL